MARIPLTTTARGYGASHRARRERDAVLVAQGEAFCAAPVCKGPRGRWISPDEPWDEGHDPYDRSRWLGPMHRGCNRNTALERRLHRPWVDRLERVDAGAWL